MAVAAVWVPVAPIAAKVCVHPIAVALVLWPSTTLAFQFAKPNCAGGTTYGAVFVTVTRPAPLSTREIPVLACRSRRVCNTLGTSLVCKDKPVGAGGTLNTPVDRKSTRLNSSHANISYAVFC